MLQTLHVYNRMKQDKIKTSELNDLLNDLNEKIKTKQKELKFVDDKVNSLKEKYKKTKKKKKKLLESNHQLEQSIVDKNNDLDALTKKIEDLKKCENNETNDSNDCSDNDSNDCSNDHDNNQSNDPDNQSNDESNNETVDETNQSDNQSDVSYESMDPELNERLSKLKLPDLRRIVSQHNIPGCGNKTKAVIVNTIIESLTNVQIHAALEE